MNAKSLIAALERRHAGDIFVSECKNGPTHGAEHRRMDAWALIKTWSPVTTIGYEVKVSRSDWLRDEKIADYLPLCHLLYIVAPKGVVNVEELPKNIGLLQPVGDGTRLVAKRKAARREVKLPTDLFVYILMCRTKITRDMSDTSDKQDRMDTLRKWVEGLAERRELSYLVNRKTCKVFEDQEKRQRELGAKCQRLEGIEHRIIELGFDPTKSVNDWDVKRRLEQLAGVVNPNLLRHLEQAGRELENARMALEGIRDAGKAA